jgi:hypothetical protein
MGQQEWWWTVRCMSRGRIEKVLDAAKAKGFRDGENPARWRDRLDHLLPRPSKLERRHHAAMPYEEIATFISEVTETAIRASFGTNPK